MNVPDARANPNGSARQSADVKAEQNHAALSAITTNVSTIGIDPNLLHLPSATFISSFSAPLNTYNAF